MPNILQLQKELESIPDDRLIQEVNAPNLYPAYLSTQELQRRQQLRESYQARMQQMPQGTVKDQLISRALSGIGSIPQQQQTQPMPAAMAMAQQDPSMMQGGMPPQGGMPMQMPMGAMAEGGIVGYSDGGRIPGYQDGGQSVDPDDYDVPYFPDPLIDFAKENPALAIGTGILTGGALNRFKVLPRLGTAAGLTRAQFRRMRDAAADVLKRPRPMREGVSRLEDAPTGRLGGLRTLISGAGRTALAPLLGYGGYQLFTGDDEEADDGILLDIGGYSDYGDFGSAGSSGSIGLGSDVRSKLMDMIEQQGKPLPSETEMMDMIRGRADLLTKNRNRLTALDQSRIAFEEEQARQMQELIDARRSRIEGRIDPEQDERDRLAMLAGIVGGAISRGRFQEGGIGGGIAAGVPSLLDLRSQQRDRAEGIEDSLDDLTMGGLQQVRDTRTAIDNIRREMITGNISDEEAQFAMQLEAAKLKTQIEARGIDPNLLLQLAKLDVDLQSAQLSANMRDRLSQSDYENTLESIDTAMVGERGDDRTPQQVLDSGLATANEAVQALGLSGDARRSLTRYVLRKIQAQFPNAEFNTEGYSDGGMVGTGFDKLIPQP